MYLFGYLFSESYVKLLIGSKNLEEKKKKVIEEFLTKAVQSYLEFNDHSGDNDEQAMKSFTNHLISVYWVHLGTVGLGSIFISLECPTLDSLEHLWSDYLSGHLHMLTERYLVPDEVKEKLKLEANILKTTIEEQNYLNCKKALVELRSTYSGEFKQNVWKAQLFTCRCSSFVLFFNECTMYKWRIGGSAIIMIIINIIIIITMTLMVVDGCSSFYDFKNGVSLTSEHLST